MPVDRWEPEKITKAAAAVIGRRMQRAMLLVQGAAQRKISVGQPVRRSKSGNLYGTTEAAPAPTPPRVLTGRLRTSITHDVMISRAEVVGRVGTNVPYARRLELGFFGADSRGRNVNAPARPFLRPSLKETLPRLLSIIGGR